MPDVLPTINNEPAQGIQATLDTIYLWNPDVANDLIDDINELLEQLGDLSKISGTIKPYSELEAPVRQYLPMYYGNGVFVAAQDIDVLTTEPDLTKWILIATKGSTFTAGTGIDITNDVISVTSEISVGAAAGATAVQPSDLGTAAYAATTDFATAAQGAKADTAAQPEDVSSAISTHNTASNAHTDIISPITTSISGIEEKIPAQASSSNQLADKNFVNSSIASNTANFIGTFNSVAELEAYSGTVTNNDYAYVIRIDADNNTWYDRYKYTTATTPAEWVFEYTLNNSSFTAAQWAAINSGATTTSINQISSNAENISDIQTTMGHYGNIVTHNVSEFATAAQGALADTAIQSVKTINGNTITGTGNVDLSTYLAYPVAWPTTGTTLAFCDAIAADTTAIKGKAYLGEVTLSDLPGGIGNSEIEVKIMDGTTSVNKVILLTLTSGNVSPYLWQYTYWNGGASVSGWVGFQQQTQYGSMPVASAATSGKIIQYTGATTQTYTNGFFYEGVTNVTPSSATATQTSGTSLSDLSVNVTTLEQFTGWTTDNHIETAYTDNDEWSIDPVSLGVTFTGTPVAGDRIYVDYVAAVTTYGWQQLNVQPDTTGTIVTIIEED